MVNLSSVQSRFEIPLSIIEGGSGVLTGVISEAQQNSQPSYNFSAPRQVLRVKHQGLLQPGVVVQTPDQTVYLVGYNGPSETYRGHLWDSFRLFRATGKSVWKRRTKAIDPVTLLERDNGMQTLGEVWTTIEQIDRESYDRKIAAAPFEQARFVASANILADDILDGRKVTRSDRQLGLAIGTIT